MVCLGVIGILYSIMICGHQYKVGVEKNEKLVVFMLKHHLTAEQANVPDC